MTAFKGTSIALGKKYFPFEWLENSSVLAESSLEAVISVKINIDYF